MAPPLQRSNSAVDATAARRALVRQQYSQNSRNKVQRTGLCDNVCQFEKILFPFQGSLRKSAEQSFSQEIPRRQSAGKRTQSQPVSRSVSPATKSLYQTHRENSDADMWKTSLQSKSTQKNIAAKLENSKSKANLQQKVSNHNVLKSSFYLKKCPGKSKK